MAAPRGGEQRASDGLRPPRLQNGGSSFDVLARRRPRSRWRPGRLRDRGGEIAVRVLAELKPGRELYTNVEYYAGVVMNSCGVPREMFTPTFAAARTVGWTVNVLEQMSDNRLIRPTARYVGPPPPQPVPPA